jgi:hypothetical protein
MPLRAQAQRGTRCDSALTLPARQPPSAKPFALPGGEAGLAVVGEYGKQKWDHWCACTHRTEPRGGLAYSTRIRR